jgi:peroxiredoxin
LGARIGDIEQLGASVVGIAVTATFSQMAFADSLGISFPLLSDWEGDVSAAYGVRYDSWKGHRGLAKRSLFVVAPSGTITYAWATDDALVLPDIEELIEAVTVAGRVDS